MSTFDEREKAFERKYVLDEEQTFKATVRRNKLLGLWAAEKLGKKGPDAENYAKTVVEADFEKAGDDDVVEKLVGDFQNAGIKTSEKEVVAEMERLTPIARQQVAGGQK